MPQLHLALDAPAPPAMPLGAAGQLDVLAERLRACSTAIALHCDQLDAAMNGGAAPRGAYARLRNTIRHSQQMLQLAERVPLGLHVRHRQFAGAVGHLRRAICDGIAAKTTWYRHVAGTW